MPEPFLEYPKMLYKHPSDKTQEHQTLVVNNPDEENAALADCHRLYPHVPVAPDANAFDADCQEAPGSGSERWPNSGWTEAGDGTGYPGDVPTQAQADAIAAQAQAERDERAKEVESEGK